MPLVNVIRPVVKPRPPPPVILFPQMVSGPILTAETFQSGTKAFNYPTTVNAGELIVALVVNDEEKGTTFVDESPGNPWVLLMNDVYTGNAVRTHVRAKVGFGDEGGGTFDITMTGGSDQSQGHCMAFDQWSGDIDDLVVSFAEDTEASSPAQLTVPSLTLPENKYYFLALTGANGNFTNSVPPSDIQDDHAQEGAGSCSSAVVGLKDTVTGDFTPADTWQFQQGFRQHHMVSIGIPGEVVG